MSRLHPARHHSTGIGSESAPANSSNDLPSLAGLAADADGLVSDGAQSLAPVVILPYTSTGVVQEATAADLFQAAIPDLVVADLGGGVDVLLGNGSGGFSAPTSYATGDINQTGVAVADLNGDGHPDLVVTGLSGSVGAVDVLLGNGAGVFSVPTTIAKLGEPYAPVVADVNGDGRADVIVADLRYSRVDVLLGNGDGTFSSLEPYARGSDPTAVAVADVNGDGHPDLVVADYAGGTVDVLLGDGSGGFSAPTAYDIGTDTYPRALAVADLNDDGRPDLVVATEDGSVDVLLGQSDGFSAPKAYGAGSELVSVAMMDVNGDGHLDVVAADFYGGADVLLGDGSGGLASATPYAAGDNPSSVAVADVNGDGRPDLVVADRDGGVDVLLHAACFLAGTLIRTPGGEVAVEALRIGDAVLLASGEVRPIRWMARQTVAARFADPLRTWPVLIRAGALAPDVPARDLFLSPDHAVYLDGILVQAGALVNGASILRETRVPARFTYYNIELAGHALILAEGLAAETFVDNIGRQIFDNAAEHAALYPDATWIEEMDLPRAKSQRQVPLDLRRRLADRARTLVRTAEAA